MTAHTPGPWTVSPAGTTHSARVCAEYGPHGDICTLSEQDTQCDGGRDIGVELANARLIAAAPELLDALESITDQLDRVGDHRKDRPFIDAARAAIAKAKGQS
jgi:hypothetical protein